MTTQYLDLLRRIQTEGTRHEDRTGTGTIRIFGHQMRFNLEEGFPILTTKRLAFRWIAEELLWMLSGSTNEKDLAAKGVDIWAEWATAAQCAKFGREEGDLGPVYGHQWRNFGATPRTVVTAHAGRPVDAYAPADYCRDGFDQIAAIVDLLVNNPNSRRIILSGWNPIESSSVALPPCHTLTQFSVIDGKLSAQMYQRSADVFLGVPYNIASYALLVHMLAHVTGLGVGDFIHTFGDVHIYSNHHEQVEEQLSRVPRRLPHLGIRSDLTDTGDNALHRLLGLTYGDLYLEGYDPHPKIVAPVSV